MRVHPRSELPDDRQADLRAARILTWVSIPYLGSVVALVYLAMGSSQAMKVAWVEDLLSLVPPIAFLAAQRVREIPPDAAYPYGRHRAVTVGYLVASIALAAIGLFLLWDSAGTLIRSERPTIGLTRILGHPVWQGWIMIAVMVYATVPVSILGRLKVVRARRIHDKGLHADARTNAADWKTGCATILGVIGIGLGWWWADSAAALLISLDVAWDGARNVRGALGDVMDRWPREVDHTQPVDVDDAVRARLLATGRVARLNVRLRDMGHVLAGEIYAVAAPGVEPSATLTRLLAAEAMNAHWRLQDLSLVWVEDLPECDRLPPRVDPALTREDELSRGAQSSSAVRISRR